MTRAKLLDNSPPYTRVPSLALGLVLGVLWSWGFNLPKSTHDDPGA